MSAFFKYAAAAAALVVILLALVIVPSGSWDIAAIVGLLLLASAAALPLALPSTLTGHGKSETGSLTVVGTSAVILPGYLILSLVTFLAAATNMPRIYVWIFAILSGAWLIIGSLVSKGSVQYLNQTFPDRGPSAPTRSIMMAELSALRSSCPKEFAEDIDRLLEKLRFAASDLRNDASLDNKSILAVVTGDLTSCCNNNDLDGFRGAVAEIEKAISKRGARLNSSRSKV